MVGALRHFYGAVMQGGFAAWAFAPGAFATAWAQRPAATALPPGWMAAELGAAGYIGPVSAALALARGEAHEYHDGELRVGGRVLIGPAGKVYAFQSPGSAARWVELNRGRPLKEWALIAGLVPGSAEVAKSRKRAALTAIAARVVAAAGRCKDAGRAAGLIAESDWCLRKWE